MELETQMFLLYQEQEPTESNRQTSGNTQQTFTFPNYSLARLLCDTCNCLWCPYLRSCKP